MNNHLQKLMLVIALSVGAYAIWIFYSGYDEVFNGIKTVGTGGFIVLIALSLFNYLLRFIRWHWMLNRVSGVAVPYWDHLQCYIAGFALTATPGKMGEALRSVYLKPYGVKVSDSVAALLAERVFDLFAVLLISALAILQFDGFRWLGLFTLLIVITLAYLLRSRQLHSLLLRIHRHIKKPWLYNLVDHALNTLLSAADFMTNRIWFSGIIIGVIAWGAEAWGFFLLVKWLTGEDAVFLLASIYGLSMIAGAVSFMPGGIGGAEAVMAGLLLILGISMADATTATIICRVVTLWLAVLLGLLVLLKFNIKALPKPIRNE